MKNVRFLVFLIFLSCISSALLSQCLIISSEFKGVDKQLISGLEQSISNAGYETDKKEIEEIISMDNINKKYDLLIIPNASTLPADSLNVIENFIKNGGKIIALNTPSWNNLSAKINGKWKSRSEIKIADTDFKNSIKVLDFSKEDLDKWSPGTASDTGKYNYEVVNIDEKTALRFSSSQSGGWNTIRNANLSGIFNNGNNLVMFWAKGSANTNKLTIEFAETDNSRWIATVSLTNDWKFYVLAPFEFAKWDPDNSFPNKEVFNPTNAYQLAIGLSSSHTGVAINHQEYFISDIYTDKVSEQELGLYSDAFPIFKAPGIDGFSKNGKFFKIENANLLKVRNDQMASGTVYSNLSLPNDSVYSNLPRPRGIGYGRNKPFRWIPIMDALGEDAKWKGSPAAVLINKTGPYANSVIASFCMTDSNFYKNKDVLDLISETASKMKNGAYLIEGGSNVFTAFTDTPVTLGSVFSNLSDIEKTLDLKIKVTAPDGITAFEKSFKSTLKPKTTEDVNVIWEDISWQEKPFTVRIELLENGNVIDFLEHELHGYDSNKAQNYVSRENGNFYVNGERIKFYGANFWSSASNGWESFYDMDDPLMHYDPEIIARDLESVKNMGLNSVLSRFKEWYSYGVGHIDFLRRCEELGIYAFINLDAYEGQGLPKDFSVDKVAYLINHYRLDKFGIIAGYDICWEPQWGLREDLAYWDKGWNDWVLERYGSIENAEKDWNYTAPKYPDGKLIHPETSQMNNDGNWRIMVSAYRKYLDSIMYSIYNNAIKQIKNYDSNHLYSFRMSMAADPTYIYPWNIVPFDFPYLGQAVDFLAPEGYGRFGTEWENVEPGLFQSWYAKYSAPDRPKIWAEMGHPIGGNIPHIDGHLASDLEVQAKAYKEFYKMAAISDMDGIFCWWYPGGFRFGENSDYGITNPDGSDRSVTKVIREFAETFYKGLIPTEVGSEIVIDRDADSRGVRGIYEKVSKEFNAEILSNKNPVLVTKGTGTTTETMPNLAVGNTEMKENKPYKYVDALVDEIFVKDENGVYKRLLPNGNVSFKGDTANIKITFINIEEAIWKSSGKGEVNLLLNENPIKIGADIGKGEKVSFDLEINKDSTMRFVIKDGFLFGEKVVLSLYNSKISWMK